MVLGHCWATLCASVPGFAPLAGERVVLVGGRYLEPAERERLSAAGIAHVGEREVGRLGPALGAAGSRVSLHLDLDVLDARPSGARTPTRCPAASTRASWPRRSRP